MEQYLSIEKLSGHVPKGVGNYRSHLVKGDIH